VHTRLGQGVGGRTVGVLIGAEVAVAWVRVATGVSITAAGDGVLPCPGGGELTGVSATPTQPGVPNNMHRTINICKTVENFIEIIVSGEMCMVNGK